MKENTTNTPDTGNPTCNHCGKPYDKKEVARVYGKYSEVNTGGYCSARCLTEFYSPSTTPQPEASTQVQERGYTPGELKCRQIAGNNRYEHCVYVDYFKNPVALLGMDDNGEVPPEEIKANAERIVYAWNNIDRLEKNDEIATSLLKAHEKENKELTTQLAQTGELLNKANAEKGELREALGRLMAAENYDTIVAAKEQGAKAMKNTGNG